MKTCSPAAAAAPAVSTAAASLPSTCHASLTAPPSREPAGAVQKEKMGRGRLSLTAPPSPLTPIEHAWGEPVAESRPRSGRGVCEAGPAQHVGRRARGVVGEVEEGDEVQLLAPK